MYTIEDIAVKLRVKVGQIKTLIRTKKLHPNKVGISYRITEEEYQRFLRDSLEK